MQKLGVARPWQECYSALKKNGIPTLATVRLDDTVFSEMSRSQKGRSRGPTHGGAGRERPAGMERGLGR